MSSMPASAMTSASPSFWQVMPLAPAASCILASTGLLCVLMCGRLAMPVDLHSACTRLMLRSTRSRSITTAGVPKSAAICALRVSVGIGRPRGCRLQSASGPDAAGTNGRPPLWLWLAPSAADGALELAQHGIAAHHRLVERRLGRFLAGQRRLDLLGPDVAQLHHVAEAQAARVLGRLLVGEFLQRRLQDRVLLVEAVLDRLLIGCLGDRQVA